MKVICTLPNASALISGVRFLPHPDKPGAMVSEDISDEQAATFASIKGYEIVGSGKPAGTGVAPQGTGGDGGSGGGAPQDPNGGGASPPAPPPMTEAEQLAAARKEAEDLGIPHFKNKGLARLLEEIATKKAEAPKS